MFCTVLYCTVLYCTVLYHHHHHEKSAGHQDLLLGQSVCWSVGRSAGRSVTVIMFHNQNLPFDFLLSGFIFSVSHRLDSPHARTAVPRVFKMDVFADVSCMIEGSSTLR